MVMVCASRFADGSEVPSKIPHALHGLPDDLTPLIGCVRGVLRILQEREHLQRQVHFLLQCRANVDQRIRQAGQCPIEIRSPRLDPIPYGLVHRLGNGNADQIVDEYG